jgi:glucose-6-phosphate isomerase
MTAKTAPLTGRPAWKALQDHYQEIRNVHMRTLFSEDPRRGGRFAVEAAGLYLDYSKHRITDETMRLLLRLAEEAGLRAHIDAMFAGEKINVTEQRAVLHVALRAPRGESIVVDSKNVVPGVHEVLDRMADFSNRIRSGEWKGHTGKRIRNIINVGIGGSPDRPFRFERRWHRFRRSDSRPRPCGNALHHLVENVHDARDNDQRADRSRVESERAA